MPKVIPDGEKVARHDAFWRRAETDRPLIGATISTFPSVRAVRGHGILTPADLDLQANLAELEAEWERWREVSGDAIWSAFPLWAFPWHLAIAGSPIQRDGENLWGLPVLDDWSRVNAIRFDPTNRWFRLLMESTLALEEQAAGRYPVGVGPLMFSPPDVMMQLRGQERLALDLHDAPDRVAALGDAIVRLCADVTDALLQAVSPHRGGYCGTSRYLWAPGKLVETGEDVSFMMSPQAHRQFLAPMHRYLGARFPYTVVHLHSQQLHTVPGLLETEEIAAIQVTPDFGEEMLRHLPVMSRILERKPLIVHGVMTVPAMKEMMRSLPPRGLALFCRCASPEEARGVLDSLL